MHSVYYSKLQYSKITSQIVCKYFKNKLQYNKYNGITMVSKTITQFNEATINYISIFFKERIQYHLMTKILNRFC